MISFVIYNPLVKGFTSTLQEIFLKILTITFQGLNVDRIGQGGGRF